MIRNIICSALLVFMPFSALAQSVWVDYSLVLKPGSQIGTATAVNDSSLTLSSVSATGAINTVKENVSTQITGVSATGSVNTVEEKPTEVLGSVSATGSIGTLTLSNSTTLTGVTATFSAGTLTATGVTTVFTASAFDRRHVVTVLPKQTSSQRVVNIMTEQMSPHRIVTVLPSQTTSQRRKVA